MFESKDVYVQKVPGGFIVNINGNPQVETKLNQVIKLVKNVFSDQDTDTTGEVQQAE